MPKLLILRNLVFLIFGVDITENRRHIHVVKKSAKVFIPAKIWLEPEIIVEKNGDFTDKEITTIVKLTNKHKELLMKQLDIFFKGERVKTKKLDK